MFDYGKIHVKKNKTHILILKRLTASSCLVKNDKSPLFSSLTFALPRK